MTTDGNGDFTFNNLTSGGNYTVTPSAPGFTFNPLSREYLNLTVAVNNADFTAVAIAGLQYYPLANPVRILDTRPAQPACDNPGAPLSAGADRTQNALITCDSITIPANALAIVGNATVVNNTPGSAAGFVTLYPSDVARPTVSNLNYTSGQVVPNAFTVGLAQGGASVGAFNIYASSSTHFIVDVTGYYAPPNVGGLYYHALPRAPALRHARRSAGL